MSTQAAPTRRIQPTTSSLLRRQLRLLLGTDRALSWRAPLNVMRFTEVDTGAEALLGYPQQQWCTPGFWSSCIHPEDRARTIDAFTRAAKDATDFSCDYRMVRRDGSAIWVRTVGCVDSLSEMPSQFHGWLIELATPSPSTEVIAGEAPSAPADGSSSRAMLAVPAGHIAIIDGSGSIIALNESRGREDAEHVDSLEHDYEIGDSYLGPWQKASRQGDIDASRVIAGLQSLLTGAAATFRLEYSRPTPSGDRWFVLQAQRLERPGGGAVVGHFDHSLRKRAALELQEARQELLRAAQSAAAGELLGAIGHDLRQPLSSIRMNAQASLAIMERAGIDSAELSEALHDILEEDDRAAEIIRVARDLVAPHQPRREPVSLNEVCKSVASLVASESAARGVKLEMDLAAEPLEVSADGRQLRQAVLSLVLNALESAFKHRSHVPVTITTRVTERGRVEVSVHDGVSRADADEGAKSAHPADHGGGLALIRAVAEAHYGYVLTDAGSDGSVVHLVVPVSRQAEEEEQV
jgi:signal transduction histidine kinase